MNWAATRDHWGGLGPPRLAGVALVAGLLFAAAGVAWPSQAAEKGQHASEQPCAEGVVGYLGITGLDCSGCTLTITQESRGWRRAWLFATEPRITEIEANSPAARVLQVGDEIVGVDGLLITAAEGGRRLASLEPNQTITIRYRRRGRAADAVLRAEARCGQFVEGMKTDPTTWPLVRRLSQLTGGLRIQMNDPGQRTVTILPEGTNTSARLTFDDILSWAAPGIRIQRNDPGQKDTTISLPGGALDITLSPKDPVTGRREASVGEWRLGLRWSCQGSCSATRKDGRRVWRFSRSLRVTEIEAGGPADTAGVRMGDQLTAVNEHRIESTRGGDAFSDLQPGQPVQLTLRGPDGRERTVTVVPTARKHEDAPE